MDKKKLRQQIALLKKGLTCEEQKKRSGIICQKLTETELFKNAHRIALYYAMSGEVDTCNLIEGQYHEKEIALPIIEGNDILFFTYQGKEHLKIGAFGIIEPDRTKPVMPQEIDLVIAPGIAFDRHLNRMGRGKGFYDRFLKDIQAPVIGICFDFQLFDEIPTKPHDMKMSMVITEKETIWQK